MVERRRFYSNNMLWLAIVVLLSFLETDFLREASAQKSVRQRALKEASVGQITSLYLINADTNRPMQELRNGAEIVASFPPTDFNIEARTNGTVGSVQFGYRNNAKYRVENFPPYAFCGNAEAYFRCNLLVPGNHTVTATPFVGASATGLAGTPLQVTFTIVEEAAVPVPAPRPTQAPVSCTRPKFLESDWQSLSPDYPMITEEPQGLIVGNDFVQFSGYTYRYTNATNHTYAKDITIPNRPWRRMEDVPVAVGITHVPTVVVGRRVYLCGGYYGAVAGVHVADCYRYDHSKRPGTGQWSRLPPLPHGGSGGGGMIYDRLRNALYYTGGAQRFTKGSTVATDVTNTYRYSFDDPSAGWVETTPLPYKGNHLSYVTHTDENGRQRHFFLGGQQAEFECCGNVAHNYEFIAATETWVRRAAMTFGRGHASASTRPIGCGFIVAGGSINGVSNSTKRTRTDDISYYDIPRNRWTSIGTLPYSGATPLVDIHPSGYMYFSNDKMSRRRIA